MLVYRHVHENVRYLERINVFPLASAHTPIHSEARQCVCVLVEGSVLSSLPPSLMLTLPSTPPI